MNIKVLFAVALAMSAFLSAADTADLVASYTLEDIRRRLDEESLPRDYMEELLQEAQDGLAQCQAIRGDLARNPLFSCICIAGTTINSSEMIDWNNRSKEYYETLTTALREFLDRSDR